MTSNGEQDPFDRLVVEIRQSDEDKDASYKALLSRIRTLIASFRLSFDGQDSDGIIASAGEFPESNDRIVDVQSAREEEVTITVFLKSAAQSSDFLYKISYMDNVITVHDEDGEVKVLGADTEGMSFANSATQIIDSVLPTKDSPR